VHREVGQKGADIRGTHGVWMAFLMKQNEAFNPLNIGFFRAIAQMLEP
jgi:hypothetical protein